MSRPTAEQRFWSKVEKTGDCWLWTASKNGSGYGQFSCGTRLQYAHRLAWSWANYCPMPPSWLKVDHTCYNTSCVNPKHLRLVTSKQNQENRSGLQTNNKSGYQGVIWLKRDRKWRATVRSAGKAIYVGYFDDVHEAGKAALAKRLELQTHNDLDRN